MAGNASVRAVPVEVTTLKKVGEGELDQITLAWTRFLMRGVNPTLGATTWHSDLDSSLDEFRRD